MAGARTFLQFASNTSGLTTYTFSAQNFGSASADRYIIAAIQARDTGTAAKSLSSVTIGGVSATIVVQRQATGSNSTLAAIATAAVPSGTSGDVVIVWSEAMLRCGLALYAATGIDGTAADSDSSVASNPSVALDIPADGIAIGTAMSSTGMTWTNLTEDHDTAVGASVSSSASAAFAAQQTGLTLTATVGGTEPVGVFASWGPATGGSAFPHYYYQQMRR